MLHGGRITQLAAIVQHATVQPVPTGHTKRANHARMPKKEYIDQETRERIAGWVRAKMRQQEIPSKAALARRLGIDRSTAGRILNATARSLGLDVFLKIHRRLPIDATQILNEPPPKSPSGSTSGHRGSILGPSQQHR